MISNPGPPYEKNALEPHISAETLEYHYGKHYLGYLAKVNKAVEGTQLSDSSLEEIIAGSSGALFNSAAQVWNHGFYWRCMSPNGGGRPTGALASAIDDAFGSFDAFQEAFTKTALGTFGSGWAWLVRDAGGALSLASTSNAETPLTSDATPLLTCDVWEHAYYIDYRNARAKYVAAFWNVVDWSAVAARL